MPQLVPCKCGTKISVPDPKIELINQLTVSMIVWAHSQAIQCPTCNTIYVGFLPPVTPGSVKMGYTPLESPPPNLIQEQPRIINPFS
jgi:hypothetical protein